MKTIVVTALPYLVAVSVILAAAVVFMSERFFKALIRTQPELSESFKRENLLVVYGPIAPAKFRYLNARAFTSLPSQELRRKGNQAYLVLAGYAVSFVALLLALLVWASTRGP